MTNRALAQLFCRPSGFADVNAREWFGKIADELLNRSLLSINGISHRLTEIEFYYRGADHHDPFAHGNPFQAEAGRWYFHQTGGAYRGGSFKGLDLTFGDGEARAGTLLRGIATADGDLVDGPSLLVDRVLELCEFQSVAALDAAIDARPIWDHSSPLQIVPARNSAKEILACARVGLTLRRARTASSMPTFLTRPYRFLTEPARIRKGKTHMVMALHRLGHLPDAIRALTGSPTKTVLAGIAEYERGRSAGEFANLLGKELGPKDLCRLHGIADRLAAIPRPVSSVPIRYRP